MAAWKMVPLGKGYYDFHFDSVEDLRQLWAAGTINLKSGLIRLSQWTKDVKYLAQKQTHLSLWIRLVELPQEYWRERTLNEIASVVGTPIDIDALTRNHTFGHYARILVDIDLSKRAYDEILVEREGFTFKDKDDRGKQIIVAEKAPPKTTRQHIDGEASTSANGSTWTWVPILITSIVTTTQRVLVTSAPSTLAQPSLAIPAPTCSPMGSVVHSTSTVDTSQMMKESLCL
ncbi:DUF4283 domain protein [Medicago truncatula]|uniref:DUF4283 domain protein n=1 Tax=Medicago truncatula TaxID=3880 RepID=A0A072V510_MEDTR|nr:DUF4283 domain protein [Medicago truncatula]